MKKLFPTIALLNCTICFPLVGLAQDDLEPEVTIVQRGDKVVEEYRLNGNLYMIKITPSKGYPYYLVDSDGDGSLDTRRNDGGPDVVIPRWTIFEW